jgi:hypothetical protein
MRPLFAILITAGLLGGVFAYLRFADSVRHTAVDYQAVFAEETYSLEIRKTFEANPDPIFELESLSVQFKGESILVSDAIIPAEEVIKIDPLEGVEVGQNELFISFNRADENVALAVIQVLVFRNGAEISRSVIASEEGLAEVSGSVVFSTQSADGDDHGH